MGQQPHKSLSFDNSDQYFDHSSPPPYTPIPVNTTPTDLNSHTNANTAVNTALSTSAFTNTLPAGYSSVMVPNHLAEATGKILIYLAQALDAWEVPQTMDADTNKPSGELTFTEEELTDLDSIPESDHNPSLPLTIDNIQVTGKPRPREIAELINFKQARPNRRAFYLARTKANNYYWFNSPRSERSSGLNKLVGDYCYKRRDAGRKVQGSDRRLRSGRAIRK